MPRGDVATSEPVGNLRNLRNLAIYLERAKCRQSPRAQEYFWNLAIAFYGYPEIRHYGRWRYCKRRTSSETEGKDLFDKCARSIVAIDSSIGSFFSL